MRKAIALGLAALAACDGGSGGDAPAQNAASITVESPYVDQLRALSPLNRDLALRRAIIDSGERCKRILGTEETGTYKNMVAWMARCDKDRNWAVYIAPNGAAQVRSCEHVQKLGLPGCNPAGKPAVEKK